MLTFLENVSILAEHERLRLANPIKRGINQEVNLSEAVRSSTGHAVRQAQTLVGQMPSGDSAVASGMGNRYLKDLWMRIVKADTALIRVSQDPVGDCVQGTMWCDWSHGGAYGLWWW